MSLRSRKIKRPRVLMLVSGFYPKVGGMERQCLKLCKELRNLGVEVYVITHRLDPSHKVFDCVEGVNVFRIPYPGYLSVITWSLVLLPLALRYDILHVHGANQLVIIAPALVRRLFRKKMVVKLVNSGERFDFNLTRKRNSLISRCILASARSADRFVAIASKIRDELRNEGILDEKILYIPNGVEMVALPDPERKRIQREKLGIEDDWCVVLRVGTLTHKKGVDFLLDAWNVLGAEDETLFLLSVGGKEEPKFPGGMDEQVRQRMRFDKNQPDGVAAYYEAADIFVLPSRTEGLSNALLEAQVYGLPCVVTDVGGNADIVTTGENGYVVQFGDQNAFVSAVKALAVDAVLREEMGREAMERAGVYDIKHIAEQYLETYRELICNGDVQRK